MKERVKVQRRDVKKELMCREVILIYILGDFCVINIQPISGKKSYFTLAF